jgi:hypothetical protein
MREGSLTGATETAVIVPVPAAEPIVGPHRADLDVAAGWGVPAHVTVLYPFAPPCNVNADLRKRLQAAVGSVSAFDCTFAETRWFGPDVLWLAPSPAQPFRDLTTSVWDAFPDYPPYGGAYAGDAPHLTVGELRRAGTSERLQEVERDVRCGLPPLTRVEQVWLIAGTDAAQSWGIVDAFSLP